MRLIALVLMFVFSVAMSESVSASPSWVSGPPVVAKDVPLRVSTQNWCSGYIQKRSVTGLGSDLSVCLFGDDRMTFGFTFTGGAKIGLVQFPFSNELRVLDGICSVTCHYSSATDTIVTQQRVGPFAWGIVIYAHASDRVTKIYAPSGEVRYSFNATSPEYEMKNDAGRYMSNPSFAVSSNGRWVVAELQDSGLALVDTNDYSTKQIVMGGHRYGYGMDPSEQLAVSDDGKKVALMGLNAGFAVTEVTVGCGQDVAGDLSRQPSTVLCKTTDLGIGNLFPNLYVAERPRFYGDGYQLEFTVTTWVEGDRRVTLLANGAKPVHKLKMLALGDSFISGEGENDDEMYKVGTNQGFDTCHTSKRSYPLLVATAIGVVGADAQSVACAGARIPDIIGRMDLYWGQGERLGGSGLKLSVVEKGIAQETALGAFHPGRALQSSFVERYDPEKILIGVGGNDAGLMGKLRVCVMPGTCEWAKGDGLRATANEIKGLFDTLGSLFSQLSRISTAKIYVAGYPKIIDPVNTCDPLMGVLLDTQERVFMDKSIEYLNQVIRAAAKKAEFTYLDIEDSFAGKQLCSGSASTAMNGLLLGDDIAVSSVFPMVKLVAAETFHPTPVGHALIAQKIIGANPDLRPDSSCVTDPMLCGAPLPSIEPPSYWGFGGVASGVLSFAADFATQSPADSSKIAIKIPDGSLQPGTKVRIEIRSDVRVLGEFTVNSRGGVSGDVVFPEDLRLGFHTLHLLGENRNADSIDMYQFLAREGYGSPEGQGVGGVGEPKSGVEADSVKVAGLSAATGDGHASSGISPTLQGLAVAKIGKVLGVTDQSDTKAVDGNSSEDKSYMWILAAAAAGLAVLTGIVLLLRRKWAKRYS